MLKNILDDIKRPPLGLTPKIVIERERYAEVSNAIVRYVNADKKIPIEWIEEYNELVNRIK